MYQLCPPLANPLPSTLMFVGPEQCRTEVEPVTCGRITTSRIHNSKRTVILWPTHDCGTVIKCYQNGLTAATGADGDRASGGGSSPCRVRARGRAGVRCAVCGRAGVRCACVRCACPDAVVVRKHDGRPRSCRIAIASALRALTARRRQRRHAGGAGRRRRRRAGGDGRRRRRLVGLVGHLERRCRAGREGGRRGRDGAVSNRGTRAGGDCGARAGRGRRTGSGAGRGYTRGSRKQCMFDGCAGN
jgi:hypothetical protein